MTITTTRRTAIAAGLTIALARYTPVSGQELGRIDENSTLAWLPALPEDPDLYPTSIVTHADMARYWETRGIDPPRSLDDETAEAWIEIGQYLPINEGVMLQQLAQNWDDITGFSLWDADQVTVANDPPDQIRIYRGRFDPDRIAARLDIAGYETSGGGDFVVLTNPDEGHDLTTELGQYTLGNFNHVAASESLVIASRSREARDLAIAAGTGGAPSLADQPSFSQIADVIAPMTGYLVLNGSALGPGGVQSDETIDGPTLPAARMLIAGITVEDTGQTVSLIADLVDAEAAEAAMAVVAERIETMDSVVSQRPYLEDLDGFEVDVVPGSSLVRITVMNEVFAMRWMNYVFAGDLRFLATG